MDGLDTMTPTKQDGWLVYRQSLQVEIRRGAAQKAITEYLSDIGYRQTSTTGTLRFERGDNTPFHLDPRQRKSEITVDLLSGINGGTLIETVMTVRDSLLPTTKPDYDTWQIELDGIRNIMDIGYTDPRMSAFAAGRARLYRIAWGLAALLLLATLMLIASNAYWWATYPLIR